MPNAEQKYHAQCPMPNGQWPMPLAGYAHGAVPRGKLPCAACRRPARAPSPHVVRYGCGTVAVHVSTAARPPPRASPLWASPTPYSKSCTSEARRWTLASFRRPDDSQGLGLDNLTTRLTLAYAQCPKLNAQCPMCQTLPPVRVSSGDLMTLAPRDLVGRRGPGRLCRGRLCQGAARTWLGLGSGLGLGWGLGLP